MRVVNSHLLGGVVVLGLLAQADGLSADSGRRWYTESKLLSARVNLDKYEWARRQRDEIIAKADKWAAYDDERLRTLVIPPQVPRCYDLHNGGCPVHGTEIYRKGLYSWIIDFDRPFKVKCPVGGEEYPSNDFAAFLASGMKDRSLLIGEYVDDGWGWHRPGDPTPANYWFVAYYAHWSMMNYLREAITNLSKAVVLTDDAEKARRYAHKCAVLLWQLAQYYPDYEYAKQSREGKEHNPDYNGKIFNHIWEVSVPNDCAPAYDAVRPYLAADRELQEMAGKSAAQIDEDIRERLLMEAARCITDGSRRIFANYGAHQRSLLTLALVLDEKQGHPTSKEMIQYVVETAGPLGLLDLGLRDALVNLIYRDGVPPESLNYNLGWIRELTAIADLLVDCGIDFYRDARFCKLLTWPFDVYLAGRFTPSLGDTGNMFAVGGQWTGELYGRILRHAPDPRFAWVLKQDAASGEDLFAPPLDEILKKLRSESLPNVGLQSTLFPAYGLANLQCGSDANRVASCLSFSSHPQHAHADQLALMLFAHKNALLTDIGYPEQTDAFNYRLSGYFTNTIAHNTVTIDAARQTGRAPGVLHAFSPHGFAQVADASCEGAYPNKAGLYRRANILVEVSPERSYLFDVFYVRGGRQHDFAIHGTQADFFSNPPLGPPQRTGTLAGPDVPYEQFYDDPGLKDKPLGSVSYTGYKGSGFQFLTNVQRGTLRGSAVCEWRLTEPINGQPDRPWKDIGLRAHLVGRDEELIACDGPVQRYAYLPSSVKCLIRRRTGDNLASRFVTVFEPYKQQAWIKNVSPVRIEPDDGDACAAMVELANGSRHYLFHSLAPEREYKIDGRVTVSGQAGCLVLDAKGKPSKAMLLNGVKLTYGEYCVSGQGLRRTHITSVDYSKGIIEIADPVLDNSTRPGSGLLVKGKGFADCVTLKRVLDNRRFSIGDEDLRVAGGPVAQLRGREIVTRVPTRYAVPGMTVVNSRMEPKGRLKNKTQTGWLLDSAIGPEDFSTAEGDSAPRYYVMMAGPQDELLVPDLVVRVEKNQQ